MHYRGRHRRNDQTLRDIDELVLPGIERDDTYQQTPDATASDTQTAKVLPTISQ